LPPRLRSFIPMLEAEKRSMRAVEWFGSLGWVKKIESPGPALADKS